MELTHEFDTRWIDLAVEQEDAEFVRHYIYPRLPCACQGFLEKTFQAKLKGGSDNYRELRHLLNAMFRTRHPAANDSMLALAKQLRPVSIMFLMPQFSKSSLPHLESLLPTVAEEDVGMVMQYIIELKRRP